jgi:hypothetical protein
MAVYDEFNAILLCSWEMSVLFCWYVVLNSM